MKKLNMIALFALVGTCSTELIYPIFGTWRRAGRREAYADGATGQNGKDAAYQASFNDGSRDKAPVKAMTPNANIDNSDEESAYLNNPSYNAPRYNVEVDDQGNVATQSVNSVNIQAVGDNQNNLTNDQQDAIKAKMMAKIEARFKEKQEARGKSGGPNANQQAKMKARMEKRFEQKMENHRNQGNGQAGNSSHPNNMGRMMQGNQAENPMRDRFMNRMHNQQGNGSASAQPTA